MDCRPRLPRQMLNRMTRYESSRSARLRYIGKHYYGELPIPIGAPDFFGRGKRRGGIEVPYDKAAVAAHMAGPMVMIECGLGLAAGTGVVMGVELGYGYIDENRTTS